MRLLLKILLPFLVVALCVLAAKTVIANRPEAKTRPQFKTSTAVEATRLDPQSYTVTLKTQGEVSAAIEGSLVAQVAGSITEVSENFVIGGSFRKGDVLAKVDPRDYEIALTLAKANYAQARAQLAEEQARADQAAGDWKKLGRKDSPSELTLRKPQLAAARANLEGADGEVQRAQLDLERTNIVAMYDGRVRSTEVSLGQYVNPGSALAQTYTTSSAEIRLPFTSNQMKFVDMNGAIAKRQPIQLQESVGGSGKQWTAKMERSEGINASSRQYYAVARVDNPYSLKNPLHFGQFVEAEVTGLTLDNVFVIPRSALREDKSVLLVDAVGTLQSREVEVAWKDADVAVISSGLEAGDVLNLTSLGSVTNGTRVKATIDGVAPQQESRGKPSDSPSDGVEGKPASGETATSNNSDSSDQNDRMQKLKKMVDAGEDLPPQAVARIKERIAAGEELPKWLKQHIAKTAK